MAHRRRGSEFLRTHARVAPAHKNIAYDRRTHRLTGLATDADAVRARTTAILEAYGRQVSDWLATRLPVYAPA